MQLHAVVNGKPVMVTVKGKRTVRELIRKAMTAANVDNAGKTTIWECRNVSGVVLDTDARIKDAGLSDFATVYVNRTPGTGG